jgi:hypothetical protein
MVRIESAYKVMTVTRMCKEVVVHIATIDKKYEIEISVGPTQALVAARALEEYAKEARAYKRSAASTR